MERIKIAAVENRRSINAEIAARLERTFDLPESDREEALRLLREVSRVLTDGTKQRT
ncbi:Arc family DNA-binding protein [Chelativorans sp. AA-79]|uniref:Arc family DNA-binding protein n=1 Tax=Chelativorans sp. AA-79 TaxID=3028735 RepID=UPI0023F67D16|nr:Arc family DNA-binding protein [Chelativorans sp. AA-79]WEX10327.1 Arc family DNA-binding protein [Chelativorans sp. AA-79]